MSPPVTQGGSGRFEKDEPPAPPSPGEAVQIEPGAAGLRERLGAAGHAELAVDLVEVPLGGAQGDTDPVGYVLVGEPLVQQAQYDELGVAERLEERLIGRSRRGQGVPRSFSRHGLEGGEETVHELRGDRPPLRELGGDRRSFVEEGAAVAFMGGERERLPQPLDGRGRPVERALGERLQDVDGHEAAESRLPASGPLERLQKLEGARRVSLRQQQTSDRQVLELRTRGDPVGQSRQRARRRRDLALAQLELGGHGVDHPDAPCALGLGGELPGAGQRLPGGLGVAACVLQLGERALSHERVVDRPHLLAERDAALQVALRPPRSFASKRSAPSGMSTRPAMPSGLPRSSVYWPTARWQSRTASRICPCW